MGITHETVWLSQTLHEDLVCLRLEVKQPQRVLADLATSHRPFEHWLRLQLLDLHGLDVTQLAPTSAHEVVFVWESGKGPAPAVVHVDTKIRELRE